MTPQSASSVGGSRARARRERPREIVGENARRPSSSSLVARARLPSRTSDDGAFVGYNGRGTNGVRDACANARRARTRRARGANDRARRVVATRRERGEVDVARDAIRR